MRSVRRRLIGLAVAATVAAGSMGVGAATAKHALALNWIGCTPDAGLAAPECPTIQGWGIKFLAADAGCSFGGIGACYATGQCYAAPKGIALTPGAANPGQTITVGGLQVGPVTVQPFSEQVPGFDVPANAIAGGAGACTSLPGQTGGVTGNVGDPTPAVTGQVCQQLYAQVANTTASVGVGSGTVSASTSWVAYGTSLCSPLAGTPSLGAASAFQLYPNLPATGAGAWVSGMPSQVYTGVYDSVVRVYGYIDGISIGAVGCDLSASACANDVFAV